MVRAAGGTDIIISVGGGSVSDTAKGLAVLLVEDGRLNQHGGAIDIDGRFRFPQLRRPKPKIIAVPTTLSEAEVTPVGSAIAEDGTKVLFRDRRIAAHAVIYDTAIIGTTPRRILLGSVFNSVAHCIEGLYSQGRSPISDALAQHAITALRAGLENTGLLVPSRDDIAVLATGAAMSGLVISTAPTGLQHAICHVLGARFGASHGDLHAVMLEHVLRYNLRDHDPRTSLAVQALQAANAAEACETIARLRAHVDLPGGLRDLGIPSSELLTAAYAISLERGCLNNVRSVDKRAIEEILRSAWGDDSTKAHRHVHQPPSPA